MPFCGVNAHLHKLDDVNSEILCVNELCNMRPATYVEEEADALTAWNTRSPAPEITALNVEVERLREVIRCCESYINSRANNRTCDVSNHEQLVMKNLLNVFTQAQSALEGK